MRVLELLDGTEDGLADISSDDGSGGDERSDDDLELDDPNEPIMESSDDEFNDMSGMESEEGDEDSPHPMQSLIIAISSSTPKTVANTTVNLSTTTLSTTNSSEPTSWSSTLQPVTINPFTSPVGPTVPIPASPLEVFELFYF